MKYILYMAITPNGYIADTNDTVYWSKAEWEQLILKVKESGNIIIGRRTYEFMLADNNFEELGNPYVLVLTREIDKTSNNSKHFFVNNQSQTSSQLKMLNVPYGLIIGGSQANTEFIEKIDQLILDIEPVLLGSGFPLFGITDINYKLELIDSKRVGENGIQLVYNVIKK
ncbi:hypothetical protein KBD45_05135 [Candidatus Dojkabacteria bacterium]|nr:hypothetical protein [Candidatus Dojkabacteria bacterium]